jgi:SOS-response transcriptional repressor LexA
MKPLTSKQHTVLAMITRHIRRYGYAPTVQEVADRTGRSKTAAYSLISQLVAKGHLERGYGKSRHLKLAA